MNLLKLVNSVPALNELSTVKLPAKVSFKFVKFLKAIDEDVKGYQNTRNEQLKKYGTAKLDANGKETEEYEVLLKTDNGKKFIAEMEELEATEVTAEIPEIKLDDLGEEKISGGSLLALEWLIK